MTILDKEAANLLNEHFFWLKMQYSPDRDTPSARPRMYKSSITNRLCQKNLDLLLNIVSPNADLYWPHVRTPVPFRQTNKGKTNQTKHTTKQTNKNTHTGKKITPLKKLYSYKGDLLQLNVFLVYTSV